MVVLPKHCDDPRKITTPAQVTAPVQKLVGVYGLLVTVDGRYVLDSGKWPPFARDA